MSHLLFEIKKKIDLIHTKFKSHIIKLKLYRDFSLLKLNIKEN